jgi:hypothetical protein
MVGGSLRVLRLLPPLKLVAIAEILLKVALNTKNQINQIMFYYFIYSVLLRQNPHNVHEWHKRVTLFKDKPREVRMLLLFCIVF